MVEVINGRDISCKDSITGVDAVYLMPYRKLLRSEVSIKGARITAFPSTIWYEFKLVTKSQFTQSKETQNGSDFYNQSLSMTFNKTSEFDDINFQKISRKDFFIIVKLKSGQFVFLGFKNGCRSTKIDSSEQQQYSVTFEAQEENLAYYITNLIGNSISTDTELNAVFQNGNNTIYQNNTNYLF
jgi:hypothetical protein